MRVGTPESTLVTADCTENPSVMSSGKTSYSQEVATATSGAWLDARHYNSYANRGRVQSVFSYLHLCRKATVINCSFDARTAETPILVIASSAEGYSFPTNLDNDPPVGGLAPQTQQALLKEAVQARMSVSDFHAALDAQNARKQA